jgi:hypothetical protein
MTATTVREQRDVRSARRSIERPRTRLRGWRRRERDEEMRLAGLRRLDDVRCVLERARGTVSAGWVQNRWVVPAEPSAAERRAPAATRDQDPAPQACLIGAVALALHERDARAELTVDGGPAIDFVWDAVQETRGLALPGVAGRAAPPEVRRARMREVAQWNDQQGRSRADVLAVLDLAISHVIMAAMRRGART